MLLEVCAYNIQSCIIAEKNGAGRIELCADPTQGGTTPSAGMLQHALERVHIPIFPMIRPKGGNFVYDADEIEIMKRDILYCRELGFPGIATGMLLPNGRIDIEGMKRLVELAHPMEVTCHKAFDRTRDALASLEDAIAAGCSRVLTSGLASTASTGAALLARLVAVAGQRIIIMPGGGVRSVNIGQLVKGTAAAEYHSSGLLPNSSDYIANDGEVKAMADRLASV